jgi:hypothetical protein
MKFSCIQKPHSLQLPLPIVRRTSPSLTFAASNESRKLHNGFCPVTVNKVEYVSVSGRFR